VHALPHAARDLAEPPHVASTCIHDLASRLRCKLCRRSGKRPAAELLQFARRKPGYNGDPA
jgi:hypothetical protein